jgi:hypothetical protein
VAPSLQWARPMTRAIWSWAALAATALLLGCTAGTSTRPEVFPESTIQSPSPDEMPAAQTSGLGTPGGSEDAGLPRLPMDGSIPHGSGGEP